MTFPRRFVFKRYSYVLISPLISIPRYSFCLLLKSVIISFVTIVNCHLLVQSVHGRPQMLRLGVFVLTSTIRSVKLPHGGGEGAPVSFCLHFVSDLTSAPSSHCLVQYQPRRLVKGVFDGCALFSGRTTLPYRAVIWRTWHPSYSARWELSLLDSCPRQSHPRKLMSLLLG